MTGSLLHPDPAPYAVHALRVSGGHTLHVQESGERRGIPALVLHGGPGSGVSPLQRRFFDPLRFRIISIDQRGAGASRPRGTTDDNTTLDLLADLRLLRERLDIARWLVVGGSWGAALALAHAADAPDAVAGLLLRSTFLARPQDIDAFFQDTHRAQPEAWAQFAAAAPPDERAALLRWLHAELTGADEAAAARTALAWWRWETVLAGTAASVGPPPTGDALRALVDRLRVQAHYLVHGCWLQTAPLLDRLAALPDVPTLLLHARNDCVCRPDAAEALAARLPHARLRWVDDAGHDASHPAMVAAMVEALDGWPGTARP